jgi:peroxiredoxin Q/BCP
VIGVSPDSVKKHQKFKQKNDLPFTLVADTDHSIAELYGVWGQKTMFGRKYMGVLRTTFVIDANGRITKVFENVKPEGHADQVAAAL